MNQFREKMSTLSNEELLKILDERMDYQPEAILAAENELKNRNLSESEIKEINDKNGLVRKRNKKAFARVIRARENKKLITDEFSDTYSLLSKETFRKNMATVSVFIVIYCIYMLTSLSYISNATLAALILIVFSGVQLWRKKKSGWIILFILLTYHSSAYLLLMIYDVVIRITEKIKPFVQDNDVEFILELIALIAFWLFINKKDFREYLKIDRKTRIITYAISGLLIAIGIALSCKR